jgi:Xaa-Pro aminopeptidase
MTRDNERIERIKHALGEAGLDAVVGTSLSIATRDGRIIVIAPRDEEEIARNGWADELHTFQPGSLEKTTDAIESIHEPLANAVRTLGITHGRIGYEDGPISGPASYAAMNLYGMTIVKSELFSSATLVPVGEVLAYLRSVKTQHEISRIRISCGIAERAFLEGANRIRAGLKETDVAAKFRTPLTTFGTDY